VITDASIVVAIKDEIHRFKYSSGSMEERFNDLRLFIQGTRVLEDIRVQEVLH
jgi:hypothetical protein